MHWPCVDWSLPVGDILLSRWVTDGTLQSVSCLSKDAETKRRKKRLILSFYIVVIAASFTRTVDREMRVRLKCTSGAPVGNLQLSKACSGIPVQ